MTISERGIALIKEFEGCVLHVYRDAAGIETIGIGHKLGPGESYPQGITEPQAELLLRKDLAVTEHCLNEWITVPLTQCQYDALVTWTFNLGVGNFREHLLPLINGGKLPEVPGVMRKFDHAGGIVVPGLMRRREAEVELFGPS